MSLFERVRAATRYQAPLPLTSYEQELATLFESHAREQERLEIVTQEGPSVPYLGKLMHALAEGQPKARNPFNSYRYQATLDALLDDPAFTLTLKNPYLATSLLDPKRKTQAQRAIRGAAYDLFGRMWPHFSVDTGRPEMVASFLSAAIPQLNTLAGLTKPVPNPQSVWDVLLDETHLQQAAAMRESMGLHEIMARPSWPHTLLSVEKVQALMREQRDYNERPTLDLHTYAGRYAPLMLYFRDTLFPLLGGQPRVLEVGAGVTPTPTTLPSSIQLPSLVSAEPLEILLAGAAQVFVYDISPKVGQALSAPEPTLVFGAHEAFLLSDPYKDHLKNKARGSQSIGDNKDEVQIYTLPAEAKEQLFFVQNDLGLDAYNNPGESFDVAVYLNTHHNLYQGSTPYGLVHAYAHWIRLIDQVRLGGYLVVDQMDMPSLTPPEMDLLGLSLHEQLRFNLDEPIKINIYQRTNKTPFVRAMTERLQGALHRAPTELPFIANLWEESGFATHDLAKKLALNPEKVLATTESLLPTMNLRATTEEGRQVEDLPHQAELLVHALDRELTQPGQGAALTRHYRAHVLSKPARIARPSIFVRTLKIG